MIVFWRVVLLWRGWGGGAARWIMRDAEAATGFSYGLRGFARNAARRIMRDAEAATVT